MKSWLVALVVCALVPLSLAPTHPPIAACVGLAGLGMWGLGSARGLSASAACAGAVVLQGSAALLAPGTTNLEVLATVLAPWIAWGLTICGFGVREHATALAAVALLLLSCAAADATNHAPVALSSLVSARLFAGLDGPLDADPFAWMCTTSRVVAEHASSAAWSWYVGPLPVALAVTSALRTPSRRASELGVSLLVLALGVTTSIHAQGAVALSFAALVGDATHAIERAERRALVWPALIVSTLLLASIALASWAEPERWLLDLHERLAQTHGTSLAALREQFPVETVFDSARRVKRAGVDAALDAVLALAALLAVSCCNGPRWSSLRPWIVLVPLLVAAWGAARVFATAS